MPFKLTKDEIKQRDELTADLDINLERLNAAITDYNEKMTEMRKPIEQAITDYNEAVNAAQDFAEDIASQADSDLSEKSEKWLEGERRQAANEWKEAWENLSFEEVFITFEEIDIIDDVTHAEDLEEAPIEMEG